LDTAKALKEEGMPNVLDSLLAEIGKGNEYLTKGGNKENGGELVSRLTHLETTLMGFGQAMQDMQSKIRSGEDPKEILQKFTTDVSVSGLAFDKM
jgi:hypothetical protein